MAQQKYSKIATFAKKREMITIHQINKAKERISGFTNRTPLLRVEQLDDILRCKVWLKPENLQKTGSFKLRGALNKLLSLTEEERKRGVVCASSGNHGQAVTYAAKLLGIHAKVVMPVNANPVKIEGVNRYGGEIVLHGTVSSEREAKMREIMNQEERVSVHPFEDEFVKAGQGTATLEILEDFPDMNFIVTPIGGGGLISGMSVAAKAKSEHIKVVGVEPTGAPRYGESRRVGAPVSLDKVDTIADGTKTDKANPHNFPIIEKYVDYLVAVTDDQIIEAMKLLLLQTKLFVEPSGALGVAAAMSQKIPYSAKDNVCFLLSGGNSDLGLFASIIKRSKSLV
ncbi:MAG: pyridoxal-phosphate dependent enzyme [Prevotellaceae bacterium]|nr:pyridoxal-phosphate dependent enzyme [Prevotellaceae bacterium]